MTKNSLCGFLMKIYCSLYYFFNLPIIVQCDYLLAFLRDYHDLQFMTLRLFKAAWFFSLMAALGALLFVYASLPEKVVVREEAAKLISLPRDGVFYIALGFMTLSNVLVYLIAKVSAGNKPFRTWFYGQIATLNLFFIVALNLLSTFNSGEHFNYTSINFIIYGSVALIVLWAISWPFYSLYKKISTKQSV